MSEDPDDDRSNHRWLKRAANLPPVARWPVLIAGSLLFGWLLELLHLPAALLLGPMAMAIAMALSGMSFRMPKVAFNGAQAIIGVMIASNMPPSIFSELVVQWPVFAVGILATVIASASLGALMVRAQIFPGTTAIWGSSPGAASVMVLMSESYGGDMRLVAFMQYLRVVCVALAATMVARLFGVTPADSQSVEWFPALSPLSVLATLAVAFGSAWICGLMRIPGAALLGPLAGCLVAKFGFGMPLVLAPWMLAIAYALVGWAVGGRFTREVVTYAARNFLRVLGSIACLLLICSGFAAMLVFFAGIDPLTAYLATSPGGADSVAIIAASTNVDVPFVMAMQIGRFLVVVLTGPMLAKAIVRHMSR
ncbi:AbrB family transcriptional regulator [Agrobacterium sp. Ap1]|nr:AbrB family transcriptional regulator [Agrobacterium sp. Ap1]